MLCCGMKSVMLYGGPLDGTEYDEGLFVQPDGTAELFSVTLDTTQRHVYQLLGNIGVYLVSDPPCYE